MPVLDQLLADLPEVKLDHGLDHVEAGVWGQIEALRKSRAAMYLQAAVAVVTLAGGVAFGAVGAAPNAAHEPRALASYAEAGPWGALQTQL